MYLRGRVMDYLRRKVDQYLDDRFLDEDKRTLIIKVG